ncbi:uncharacterized protein RCC_09432 [Ramularia collo-cygni]|uniref:Rhodopsin domain-containing protein n=1 Tax=Ramularia collo-cygni TaxID=112498 RepID=A0A2D3VP93_9PEZI|nr:uncharacterized protein RCC_09432 [Ramularia collo-cygni]CZT23718.1 uncharacterized protein RCC_09432 [Ramularia collo-cygni]
MAGLYDHPISRDFVIVIAVTAVFTFLSGLTIILRFLSRRISSKLGLDDWFVLAAYVCALAFVATNVLAATIGMAGYPVEELDTPHLVAYQRQLLANNMVYNASITLSKVAIVLMYRRFFPTPTFKAFTWPVLGLLAAFYITIIFGEIFAYTPINGQWNPNIPSTHINIFAFGLSMAAITIFLDVTILTMPQFVVWRLQMSRHPGNAFLRRRSRLQRHRESRYNFTQVCGQTRRSGSSHWCSCSHPP